MLDSNFWPLLTLGSGPNRISFVDFIRDEVLSPAFRQYSQLEVYHWMIEWATRPYYNLVGAVYESRILEAVLINDPFLLPSSGAWIHHSFLLPT